jgi:hypothetical protein
MKQRILTSGQPFSAHIMHQKRLAAGLRPDPLGELTALPRPPSCFKGAASRRGPLRGREGKGKGKGKGRGRKERGREEGGKGKGRGRGRTSSPAPSPH